LLSSKLEEDKLKDQSCYQLPVREHLRLKALPRALVYFNQSHEQLPYHIVDISMGGLSFRYLGKTIQRGETCSISLYHEGDLIVDNLSAMEVSDILLYDDHFQVHRGSVHFSSLSNEKQRKLSNFIETFTESCN
jgi:c-di-GMP-binding flagellar brake protein YcgR